MSDLRENDLIFLVAGEPSGDALGARLMAALKRATGGRVRFAGVGGERMAGEGLTSLFPLTDIAVMGFTEVVPRLPVIFRRLRETADAIWAQHPAAVVTIDAPSFGLRIADRVRASGVPLIHYVAPQLWAWRPSRARKLAGRVDRLLALLPFEPEFFGRLGVTCTYVGHPVIEGAAAPGSGSRFRQRYGVAADSPIVLVLPGSRIGLARRMLPLFQAAVGRLATRHPALHAVLPTVAGTDAFVRAATAGWQLPHTVVSSLEERRDAIAAAGVALSISGTATLELAVAGVPMVVGYRVGRLTELLARRMIEVPYVAMPNLILGCGAVPELLQDQCTPDALATQLDTLLRDGAAQRADLVEIRRRLGLAEMQSSGVRPSDRAAQVVLETIRDRRRSAY